jgi:aerobic C4-dicarboxylate transport protein
MAFTVGQYGVASLISLGKLMIGVRHVRILCLRHHGAITAATGFNIVKFLAYRRGNPHRPALSLNGTAAHHGQVTPWLRQAGRGLVVPTGYHSTSTDLYS